MNVPNTKEYYKAAIASLFPNQITLKENKRCVSPVDRNRMKEISDKFKSAKSKQDILKVLFDNCKSVWSLDKVSTSSLSIVYTNHCGNIINEKMHSRRCREENVEKYFAGLKLIGRTSAFIKGKYHVYVNYVYEIERIEDNTAFISDLETEFPVEISELDAYFKLPYARTCHSLQGLSVKEEITIFEFNHPHASLDWLYTAITRTTDLSKVSIFRGSLPGEPNLDTRVIQIRKRIYQHKQADKLAGRRFDEASYITVNWVLSTLGATQYCGCEQSLDITNYSVDRLNNALPHTKQNCRIICLPCNLADKKDYEINF